MPDLTGGRQISREDYYKLTGLLTLAKEHNAGLATITRAAAQITGEEVEGGGYAGLTSDAISCDYSAAELCTKLGIEIADELAGDDERSAG